MVLRIQFLNQKLNHGIFYVKLKLGKLQLVKNIMKYHLILIKKVIYYLLKN